MGGRGGGGPQPAGCPESCGQTGWPIPQLCRRATAPPLPGPVRPAGRERSAPTAKTQFPTRCSNAFCSLTPPLSLAHSLNHKCRARSAQRSPPADFGCYHSLVLPRSLRPRARWRPSSTRAGTHWRRAAPRRQRRLAALAPVARTSHALRGRSLARLPTRFVEGFLAFIAIFTHFLICFCHFLKNL